MTLDQERPILTTSTWEGFANCSALHSSQLFHVLVSPAGTKKLTSAGLLTTVFEMAVAVDTLQR